MLIAMPMAAVSGTARATTVNADQFTGSSALLASRLNQQIELNDTNISPDRLPPPPPGVYATIAFYIFNGLGKITFDGVTYSNGQSVKVTGDESYPISTSNVNSNYHFQQWDSNIGSFGGSTSSTTTVNAGSGTGNIVLVPHEKYTSEVFNNYGYRAFGVFVTFGARAVLTWLTTNGNALYQFLNTTNIVSNCALEIAYWQEESAG